MRFKSLLRRGICITLATIFLCSDPLQVFAEEAETALPGSYEGVNAEEVESQTELTEEQFDATLTSLQATHTNAPIAPILTAPEFSQECKVAPQVSKSGRSYHVDSVTFSGTATGNGVTGVKYRKNSDEEFVELADYTKEAEVVGTNEVPANPDDPEDDTTTTVDVTVDHITWTVTIPADQLETGKSYLPEVSYVFAETKTNEDGTEEVVESTREFTTNTFAIVSVGRNQKLSKIAKQYGTTVATIKSDNQITSSLAPKKNSTIYITNPVLEEARNTTDVWTPELVNALTMQGEIPGMEYAYGYVSLYDGALFYSDVDFEIMEQETTEVEKVFHSKAQDIEGVFGYGTSSLFDVKVIELDDNTFLFYMTDGHGVKLTKSGTNYVSADGEYTLTVFTDEENQEMSLALRIHPVRVLPMSSMGTEM
ncbi:MAG: LysM peptidoglycan-binding domain-containing protein [Lachnospiraceae bacterium]|nr:LysM peptidoglycan-binding domain-containing protein [Lachnospiraceae bacterium]